MNALERSANLYEEYLTCSQGVLPEVFRESDSCLIQVVEDYHDADWSIFPEGLANILEVYRRWKTIEDAHRDVPEDIMRRLYRRFNDMCFRQQLKVQTPGAEDRYEKLAELGVTPESITIAFITCPEIERHHNDVISAYGMPFFGYDAAFADLITNPASLYRTGTRFHEMVAEERKKDRERRQLEARMRAAK